MPKAKEHSEVIEYAQSKVAEIVESAEGNVTHGPLKKSPSTVTSRTREEYDADRRAAKDAKKARFLEVYRDVGTIRSAADLIGVSRKTVYQWQQEDGEFARLLIEADQDTELAAVMQDVISLEAHLDDVYEWDEYTAPTRVDYLEAIRSLTRGR